MCVLYRLRGGAVGLRRRWVPPPRHEVALGASTKILTMKAKSGRSNTSPGPQSRKNVAGGLLTPAEPSNVGTRWRVTYSNQEQGNPRRGLWEAAGKPWLKWLEKGLG